MFTWTFPAHRRATSKHANGRRAQSLRAAVESLEARSLLSVGGGFTDAGVVGEYFSNTTLAGTPAFTRKDVRIDFNWSSQMTPGGSTSPEYRTISRDNYSVRWTGQVVPRFTETYRFVATADDGVRVFLKPAAETQWTQLLNDWSNHSARTSSGTFSLVAGQAYDIRMEYYEATGSSVARLAWSSPSTPEEIIDPLGNTGINLPHYADILYADAIRMGRIDWGDASDYFGKPKVAQDADGWPLADGTKIVWEGRESEAVAGTYLLQFQGKASVSTWFNHGQFRVGNTSYGSVLPSGAGYDPVTNTTTAFMDHPGYSIAYLTFKNSQRTAASPLNSGVTQVRLMRPDAPGSKTPYPIGTMFADDVKDALGNYTTQRWLTANFNTTEANWSDRTLPSFSKSAYFDKKAVWENTVLMANETGRDLYITIPINASLDYVRNLANLIRYGSDGVNPYTAPKINPTYPGLNPNLRVYVEWSNEVWNWNFSQSQAGIESAKNAVLNDTPDGRIINYDGRFPTGDWRRFSALRTVQTSDIFRSVFGDAAMGPRVRMLLEYQYDNQQGTAQEALNFIDNYFNNGDGQQNVAVPRPVNYYLWGAGGATYYGALNKTGAQDAIQFASPGLEPVASGTSGAGWTFVGNAGVLANATRVSAAGSPALGTTAQAGTDLHFGFEFTVGSKDVGVYELGRWVSAGNTKSHTVRLVESATKKLVTSASISTSGAAAGAYKYAKLAFPVVLKANTRYILVTSEASGQDSFFGADTAITPGPGITVHNAVRVGSTTPSDPSKTASWIIKQDAVGARTFGPVDIRFAPEASGDRGFVIDAPEGTRAAYIGDTGEMIQSVHFAGTGTFAIQLSAANKANAANGLRVFVDDYEITPYQNDYLPANGRAWTPGSGIYGLDPNRYNELGTAPFEITTPGYHEIRIVGTAGAGKYTYLDNFQITSLDAIFDSGIPGKGEANGQTSIALAGYQAQLNNQARHAQAYGLQVVAYEGGWSLGGDAGGTPLQNYAKYVDRRAIQANLDATAAFNRSGGDLLVVGTYDQWPHDRTAMASEFPLVQAVKIANNRLPELPTNGLGVNMVLDRNNRTVDWRTNIINNQLVLNSRGWVAWNVVVPLTGWYDISMNTTTGGATSLYVDESTAVATAANGGAHSGRIFLRQGLHSIKMKVTTGSVQLIGGSIYRVG